MPKIFTPDAPVWASPIAFTAITHDGLGAPHVRLTESGHSTGGRFDIVYAPPQARTKVDDFIDRVVIIPRIEPEEDQEGDHYSDRHVAIESVDLPPTNTPLWIGDEAKVAAEEWWHSSRIRAGFYEGTQARIMGFLALVEIGEGTRPHELSIGDNLLTTTAIGIVLATTRVVVAQAYAHHQQGY